MTAEAAHIRTVPPAARWFPPNWRALGQLLRLPNLLTVPGDPAVGFLFVAWMGRYPRYEYMAAACVAGVLLYMFGLVLNDLRDRGEDAADRPHRPIPSGRVSPMQAMALAVGLAAGGMLAAALTFSWAAVVVAAVLLAMILAYDLVLKRIPAAGPLSMGLCRALSVLLGASVKGWAGVLHPPALLAAAIVGAYVAAVTLIARRETAGGPVGHKRNFPSMILAFSFVFVFLALLEETQYSSWAWPLLLLPVGAVAWAARAGIRLGLAASPGDVQKNVGRLVLGLLLVQATLACMAGLPGVFSAVILAALFPVALLLGRRFYAS